MCCGDVLWWWSWWWWLMTNWRGNWKARDWKLGKENSGVSEHLDLEFGGILGFSVAVFGGDECWMSMLFLLNKGVYEWVTLSFCCWLYISGHHLKLDFGACNARWNVVGKYIYMLAGSRETKIDRRYMCMLQREGYRFIIRMCTVQFAYRRI